MDIEIASIVIIALGSFIIVVTLIGILGACLKVKLLIIIVNLNF